jgi:polar amino acid transport system substrate-binding protein
MKVQRISGTLALLMVFGLILGACQPQQATTAPQPTTAAEPTAVETTIDRAKREGIIRVGFANEAPFAYAKPDGTLAGEAPDIAKVIFERLGIAKMEGILTEFGSLIPGLQANRFDVITAGMYIKPERCEQVLFADPEYKIGSGLLIQAGNPLNLHSYEDIAANPDARVGTGAGYFEADYLAAVVFYLDQFIIYV